MAVSLSLTGPSNSSIVIMKMSNSLWLVQRTDTKEYLNIFKVGVWQKSPVLCCGSEETAKGHAEAYIKKYNVPAVVIEYVRKEGQEN